MGARALWTALHEGVLPGIGSFPRRGDRRGDGPGRLGNESSRAEAVSAFGPVDAWDGPIMRRPAALRVGLLDAPGACCRRDRMEQTDLSPNPFDG